MNNNKDNSKRIALAKRLLQEAIKAIDKKLELGIETYYYSAKDLRDYRSMLNQLLDNVESGVVNNTKLPLLGIGRQIVDSWPLNCEFGDIIIEAEQAYKRI